MADEGLRPIIVKRIKKTAAGHHGGAWKIAYADFVTAMMAFFLLMWLLGSTTDGDKKGIADYFQSPLKIALAGGSGSGDSNSVLKGGGESLTSTVCQVKKGDVEAQRNTINLHKLKAEQVRAEISRLEDLKQEIQQKMQSSEKLKELSSQIRLDMTRDGLRIQIVDDQNRPMFASGSATIAPYMKELLREIGSVLTEVPNRLTLEGHTDAQPFPGGDRGYSNWELSSDRANASRRELITGGLADDRVLRVQGLASSQPFDEKDPLAPTNRRISIIVMNREAEDRMFRTDPDKVAPDGADSSASSATNSTPAATADSSAPAH
ncbi:MAG: flagellar motor protein MotB [Betaproteobacteria bacterium]